MVTELQPGMLIGRYRLREPIAEGGMGSVWSALDTQLDRCVAVKLLPRILVTDPSAERRFEREARAMSRLQHPNVVSIYDVGSADPGTGEELPFLVMELVRGDSLDKLLADGPLPPHRAARILEQVGRAIGAAHAAGVVHRDLKPSNVMVSDGDYVSVLDFGLARLVYQDGQTPEDTLTTPGMVLGSCPYMAPEQALGQQVGPSSDIFSCGAVLYESLAGQRTFDGATPMRVLQAVVRCEYEALSEIAPDVPASLVAVVEKCLQKNPTERFANGADLAQHLAMLLDSGELKTDTQAHLALEKVEPPPPAKGFPLLATVGALVLALAGGGAAGFFAGRSGTESLRPDPGRWTTQEVFTTSGVLRQPDWAPDGQNIVVARDSGVENEILVVPSSGGSPRVLTRARASESLGSPRFSPDGKAVVIESTSSGLPKLRVLSALGGTAYAEIENARRGAWFDNQRLVFSRMTGATASLWSYDMDTGAETLMRDADQSISWWAAEPMSGGDFAALGGAVEQDSGIFVFSGDSDGPAEWLAPGDRIFGFTCAANGKSIAAAVGGSLFRLANGQSSRLFPGLTDLSDPSFSPEGSRLAAVRQSLDNSLVTIDPDGGWSCLVCDVPDIDSGSKAADGATVYVRAGDGDGYGDNGLYVRETGARERQILATRQEISCPSFSPDGQHVAYVSGGDPSTPRELRLVPRTGGDPITLAEKLTGAHFPSWSPDGRFIAFSGGSPPAVKVVPAAGGDVQIISRDPGSSPTWSPSGKWIAYVVSAEVKKAKKGVWVVPAEGGEATKIGSVPAPVFWTTSGDRIVQLRLDDSQIELWETDVETLDWERRTVVDPSAFSPGALAVPLVSTDPETGHPIVVRHDNSAALLLFDGIDPKRW